MNRFVDAGNALTTYEAQVNRASRNAVLRQSGTFLPEEERAVFEKARERVIARIEGVVSPYAKGAC